jgi:hypothetical protein
MLIGEKGEEEDCFFATGRREGRVSMRDLYGIVGEIVHR